MEKHESQYYVMEQAELLVVEEGLECFVEVGGEIIVTEFHEQNR
jgi:hypothetical protein